MIEFKKTQNSLQLIYSPEDGRTDWVRKELDTHNQVKIRKTFFFSRDDFVEEVEGDDADDDFFEDVDDENYTFELGSLKKSYFKISGTKLGIEHDVYLDANMPVSSRTFMTTRDISIFRQIAHVTAQDIYIGGNKTNALPISEFNRLLSDFPNSTELSRYAQAKVARILKDYFETTTPAEKAFDDYLAKRGRKPKAIHQITDVYQYEATKYEFICDRIIELLKDENSFGENEWRDLMLQFIFLIFPKYVCVLRNVRVRDFYTTPSKPKNRYIDIALVDANGHLDIIEIKKPFDNCLVSESDYRGSFTPRRELSGAIMQAEKYVFHLAKWGVEGEMDINKRQASHLPAGLKVRITNPKAIVIAGRSNSLSQQQLFDFEIMKRKYANIVDILSYDDLLGRLSNIVAKFQAGP